MRAASAGVAVFVVVVGSSVPAAAHHSHPAFYDACKSLTIEGKIDSVQWKNPHVLIDLTTADGRAYRAEWTSVGALARRRMEPPKPGDSLVVTGNPMRDVAAIRARFPDVKFEPSDKPVVDVTQIRDASNSWNWTRDPDPTPLKCGEK
ncbi:MAG TPA: DUF6152 family protein [Vicinamibacterales bacterium]|nr:DUF6152 family protein [Vicinamibacterales bacterium]